LPRIPDEVVERLRKEVDLAELVRRGGVELSVTGTDLVGRCPFHDDRTPSLVVTPSKGLWHCMGACSAGGSVIDWVMRAERVSFRHAVELLSEGGLPGVVHERRAPSSVRRLRPLAEAGTEEAELLQRVVAFYHEALWSSTEALSYLERRCIADEEMLRRFRIGLSERALGLRIPQRNRVAGAELREKLCRIGILRSSGHEHFSGSIVVPVTDEAGAVVELYGRKLRDDLRPGTPDHLYLPGPHAGVFNHEGLASGEVILCESLVDALSFYCAGLTNVTASYGTAGFTDDHRRAFKDHDVSRVLIAYDNDPAGNTAAARLAAELEEAGIECFRVVCPTGTDVNDVACAAADPAKALAELVRNARWVAPGKEVAVPAVTVPAGKSQAPPVSPAPSLPQSTPVLERDGNELTLSIGEHRWRVRHSGRRSVDVLRVNLAVSNIDGALHLDTLDLYSARQRGTFCKGAAAVLGVEEAALAKEIGQVLLASEQAEGSEEEDRQAQKTPAPKMTENERAEALALLRDPDLTGRITADLSRLGLVGEEHNALVCYLAVVSRKCERPLGVLVQSASSAGKSTLVDTVLSLCPEEEAVSYSAMTGQSLYYLSGDLSHKVLAIAEEEGASRASYALKLLQSEGRLSIASTGKDPVSGRLVTHTYVVKGPVALVTTTTSAEIDEELANRLIVLAVAEDVAQTRAIQDAQRQALTLQGLRSRSARAGITALHRNAQRLLQAFPIVVPGAESLAFPAGTTRARRDNAKYLQLICASAILHQHQRRHRVASFEGTEIEYLEASAEDVALAERLAGVGLVPELSELTPATRRVLDGLVAWGPPGPFTRRQAREALCAGDTQLKVHLARLVELELVACSRQGTAVTYELAWHPAEQKRRTERTDLVVVAGTGGR
jgi:DNA primase